MTVGTSSRIMKMVYNVNDNVVEFFYIIKKKSENQEYDWSAEVINQ